MYEAVVVDVSFCGHLCLMRRSGAALLCHSISARQDISLSCLKDITNQMRSNLDLTRTFSKISLELNILSWEVYKASQFAVLFVATLGTVRREGFLCSEEV